jgi:hypothetical protein
MAGESPKSTRADILTTVAVIKMSGCICGGRSYYYIRSTRWTETEGEEGGEEDEGDENENENENQYTDLSYTYF